MTEKARAHCQELFSFFEELIRALQATAEKGGLARAEEIAIAVKISKKERNKRLKSENESV